MLSHKTCKGSYDAIIIGSGIGGLVCANYLSKAGKKVLLIEQHFQPGGCCTSFKRKGFVFDAGGHYFGNYRKDGIFRGILEDLEVDDKISFIEADPADHIIFPDFSVYVYRDFDKTVYELSSIFPCEKENIEAFIKYIKSFNFTQAFALRNTKFEDILNSYFQDTKLKAVFDVLLLYIGLPASEISAVAGIILYRDFILDGGYYPSGGMQAFSNKLAQKIVDFGGDVLLSNKVEKIEINDGKVAGVELANGKTVKSEVIVSNADISQTLLGLVGEEHLESEYISKLKSMKTSVSHFNIYLGIKSEAISSLDIKCNTWYITSYDISSTYKEMLLNPLHEDGFVHLAFPSLFDSSLAPEGYEAMFTTVLAPYETKEFWDRHRGSVRDTVIKRAENVIPGLSQNIVVEETSTPHTIERYTLNKRGANYGWEMNPSQVGRMRINQESIISGLYFAGHWTQPGAGLATAAQSGFQASKLILKK
jgi:phytoene dehydrogenase-like protein